MSVVNELEYEQTDVVMLDNKEDANKQVVSVPKTGQRTPEPFPAQRSDSASRSNKTVLDEEAQGTKPSDATEAEEKTLIEKNPLNVVAGPGTPSVRKEAWIADATPKSNKVDKQLPQPSSKAIKFSDDVVCMKHAIEQIMLVKIKQRRDAEKSFRWPNECEERNTGVHDSDLGECRLRTFYLRLRFYIDFLCNILN